MSAVYTIPEIKNIVCPLAKEYGAERVYLFGSYARGESTKNSDIDLRIDKGNIRGLALAGLLLDLEKALGCTSLYHSAIFERLCPGENAAKTPPDAARFPAGVSTLHPSP